MRGVGILLLLMAQLSVFAQGRIYFNNRNSVGDTGVSRPDGRGAGAGVTAQLMLVGPGGELTPLFPTTSFRTFSPATEYFIVPVQVDLPGVPGGSAATFRMRAWEGSSWENATLRGESNDVFIPYLAGSDIHWPDPLPEPDLSGLQGFTLAPIPEPSTIAFGVLGLVLISLRRSHLAN